MPEADFLLKRGDTSSGIYATLENSGGTAVDILGASVRWKMAPISGGTLTVNDVATNAQVGAGGTSNLTTGQVVYNWATHPGTAGRYLGEWEVTYAGGSIQSFPNGGYLLVDVLADL
jgi:hypothetical protein